MNRLDVFRSYMAQFDAAADPVRAIDRGQYVTSARALADRVRPRVELEPHSTLYPTMHAPGSLSAQAGCCAIS